jgi:hypothetical protein
VKATAKVARNNGEKRLLFEISKRFLCLEQTIVLLVCKIGIQDTAIQVLERFLVYSGTCKDLGMRSVCHRLRSFWYEVPFVGKGHNSIFLNKILTKIGSQSKYIVFTLHGRIIYN